MIIKFPQFKNIELSDQEEIEKITKRYPPYSDFNFVSLWSWNIKGKTRLALLNGNLVVRFTDYLTGEPFYSFLGDNKADETAEALLELSKKEGLKLKLVPEASAKALDGHKFRLAEDRDHFDYVLDLNLLAKPDNRRFRSKRRLINKLILNNKCQVTVVNDTDQDCLAAIRGLAKKLKNNLKVKNFSAAEELSAIDRALASIKNFNLVVAAAFINEKLCGFAIKEVVDKNYAMGHFLKADVSLFPGSASYLMQQLALVMLDYGCGYINIEQDLGIENLRKWKKSYSTGIFLKKYIITQK
jgi:uncharacterized protein